MNTAKNRPFLFPSGWWYEQCIIGNTVKATFHRTWALQERLLATRIVHFSKDELFWECQSQVFCDCTFLDQHRSIGGGFRIRQDRLPPKYVWIELLEQYSRLDLTYLSDRLPAISGLVKRLQGQGLGKYVAGLWIDQILTLLCWRSPEVPRPQQWQAPSWSWACADFKTVETWFHVHSSHTSLRGRASSSGTTISQTTPRGKKFRATFLSIDYKLEGEDPTGRVEWTTLSISAPCINVRIRRTRHQSSWHIFHGEERMITTQMVPGSRLDSPKDDFRGREEIPCVAAWIATWWPVPSHVMDRADYLVLQPSQGLGGRKPSPGCYEMVGVFQITYDPSAPSRDENKIFGWFDNAEVETVMIV